jgi:uncharacterized protein (TIGR02246 family)
MNDEQMIRELFETADRALMSADMDGLARTFADDYVQYNELGKASTKAEILAALRTSTVRYPSIVSTGRTIRLFGDTAVVHGSESDEVVSAGERSHVNYAYLDVVHKRQGQWQIVASQLVRLPS